MNATVNSFALAMLTYKVAELTGVDAPVVQLLKQAAETGDPDIAAAAFDAFCELPPDERKALAVWLAEAMQELPCYIADQ